MTTTLRTKLLIGLTPLLALLVGLGAWAVVMFSRLGNNIDVILRENYRSVLYAQNNKEALERIDSALLFAIGGEERQAREQFDEHRPVFEENLRRERANITLPGEQAIVDRLDATFARYVDRAERFLALPTEPKAERTRLYFDELLPNFLAIKRDADTILDMNQRNMEDQSARARQAASTAIRLMALALAAAIAVATAVALVLGRAILRPIRAVTDAARQVARGDLDQVVPVPSRDELGELAGAFNAMARNLRELRQAGTERLLRAQKTAQATIDSFPDPVVVVDPAGEVERSNPAARRALGVGPGGERAADRVPATVAARLVEVLAGGPDFLPTGLEYALCLRDDGQERFFLPRVLAIRGDDAPLGAAVVLQDVTRFRLVDQLKTDMVSTVSHELKTPLTGVQMAVHLLLEEVVGPLTPKQVELLVAARQDSDRLLAMVNDLLDLARIEQGRIALDRRPADPAAIAAEAVGRFEARARDAGVDLSIDAPRGLPAVAVDRERLDHVFDNLLANALRHTGRGGRVSVSAQAEPGGSVAFAVSDTGVGIPPEHLGRIFEKFYRVPGARGGGAGLGLAIAREIVDAHGGRLEAASEVGAGATFTLRLLIDRDGDARTSTQD